MKARGSLNPAGLTITAGSATRTAASLAAIAFIASLIPGEMAAAIAATAAPAALFTLSLTQSSTTTNDSRNE